MKLADWKSVADICAGIAVIVTLVILVFEIQNNTQAVKAATYDNLLSDVSDWRMNMALNDTVSEMSFERGTEGDDALEPLELYRLVDTAAALFMIYERAWIQHHLLSNAVRRNQQISECPVLGDVALTTGVNAGCQEFLKRRVATVLSDSRAGSGHRETSR